VGRGCLVSSEERRNKSRIFVHKFFRHLVFVFKALGVQIVLRHIDLSHTESSLRSVISLPFVKQIDTLDLSFTLISWRSLSYLNFLPNLTKLFLNHCPKLSRGVSMYLFPFLLLLLLLFLLLLSTPLHSTPFLFSPLHSSCSI
jgi:hypothetical protein